MSSSHARSWQKNKWLWSIFLSLIIAVGGTIYILNSFVQPSTSTIIVESYDAERDVATLSSDSTFVVEGIVEAVLPSQWTTTDGKAPQDGASGLSDATGLPPAGETILPNGEIRLDDALESSGVERIQLRTPVQLSVERTFKGENVPSTLLFTFPGGSDGTQTMQSGFGSDLKPGMRVVVFLSTAPENADAWAKISPLYPQGYFVVEGDRLHSAHTTLTWTEFFQQLNLGGK